MNINPLNHISIYDYLKKNRQISLQEMEEHRTVETGLWIAWQDPISRKWFVSAMADFVDSHPGGSKILEAGGQVAMPFWQQFTRHLDSSGNPTPIVLQELKCRIVGELMESPKQMQTSDPYAWEPNRQNNNLSLLQEKPYNAGQIPCNLSDFTTPLSDIFVRFHTPAPCLQNHQLKILIGNSVSLESLSSLANKLSPVSYSSVLQCTGHRRSEMKDVNGLQWNSAVANVEIKGYRLWDLLHSLGITSENIGYFLAEQLDPEGKQLFSCCIPLSKIPFSTLLATEMNQEMLDRDHGGPLRLWVPGFNGNFSVKAINQIRILSPEEMPKTGKYENLGVWGPAIALSSNLTAYVEDRDGQLFFQPDLKVNAMACIDPTGVSVELGDTSVFLKGWAWSGGGKDIRSVQFSTDEGTRWTDAVIDPIISQPFHERYSWTEWKSEIPIHTKMRRIFIRATDTEGDTQPRQAPWNPRGLRNNAWVEVPLRWYIPVPPQGHPFGLIQSSRD